MSVPRWTAERAFAAQRLVLYATAAVLALACSAQQQQGIAGDYAGEIGSQHATLHLKIDASGQLKGNLDHLDPKAPWMFWLSGIQLEGQALSFAIPEENVTWKGTVSGDGDTLAGTWTERGASGPVTFVRQMFAEGLEIQ